jgi:UPF0176 protein
MAILHNRVSRRELKRHAQADQTPRQTISFYRYTPIVDPKTYRNHWYQQFQEMGVYGRIYMAREGVNAQVSVPRQNMQAFHAFLEKEPGFENLRLNLAVEENGKSFFVLDIKVKTRHSTCRAKENTWMQKHSTA